MYRHCATNIHASVLFFSQYLNVAVYVADVWVRVGADESRHTPAWLHMRVHEEKRGAGGRHALSKG